MNERLFGKLALLMVFTLILLLAGCSEPEIECVDCSINTSGEINATVTEENGTTTISIHMGGESKRECLFQDDCDEGKTCIDDRCLDPSSIDECAIFSDRGFDKDLCIKHVALKNNDRELCGTINDDPRSFNTVEADCFTEMAIKMDDLSLCESSTGCYERFAFSKADVTVCEKITTDIYRENCVRRVTLAQEHPEMKEYDALNNDWVSIAKETNDSQYCEYSNFEKEECYEHFEQQE